MATIFMVDSDLDEMRQNGKWHLYDPDMQKQDLRTLLKIVEEDETGAFLG